ncbi:MAG: Cache 3/Cache 2 fusion domain-containing protein [Proteobacteria bacterium]|nr:Cache 3/Cache 2 fusion domain-containing protein [Pseudomonadota bacterium]MBU1546508.1 Cache 3/Cache 2 fusion domain-containing protein [Pseudomonadota bacterium]MBU2620051.1 Cache 3/Cache 2 fusion domain-containing protein [Pseudomonadota bacterium]
MAATESSAKIKTAMAAMKDEAAKLGAPKIEGGALFFGASKINDNYALVDSLKAKFGCTATFFMKKGDAFVRVSTNVMKDGKRAVGTPLDPSGPAIAAIRQGNAFYGMVDILGKLYDTGYEPIKNAGGEIIGVYYIGYLME